MIFLHFKETLYAHDVWHSHCLCTFHTPQLLTSAFSTLHIFYTPHYIFLALPIFKTPHFPHFTFSTLHTTYLLHSPFSKLHIFHSLHFLHSVPSTLPISTLRTPPIQAGFSFLCWTPCIVWAQSVEVLSDCSPSSSCLLSLEYGTK